MIKKKHFKVLREHLHFRPRSYFLNSPGFGIFGILVFKCKKHNQKQLYQLIFNRKELLKYALIWIIQRIILEQKVFNFRKNCCMLQLLILATYQSFEAMWQTKVLVSYDLRRKIPVERDVLIESLAGNSGGKWVWESRNKMSKGTFWALERVAIPMGKKCKIRYFNSEYFLKTTKLSVQA